MEVLITMLIRDFIKNRIFGALNYDVFRYEDFDIVENDDYNGFIQIKYSDYYFRMEFGYEYCEITISPGDVFTEETIKLKLIVFEKKILFHLHNWLNVIKIDMLNPLERRFVDNSIQEFREEMDSKLKEMEDEYFTKDEGDNLREKLEHIEEMILDMDSKEELQTEISKMKDEIQFLKATIDTLTKKKWLKNALVKMWSWGQKDENRKLIESGVEAVKAISQMDIPKL